MSGRYRICYQVLAGPGRHHRGWAARRPLFGLIGRLIHSHVAMANAKKSTGHPEIIRLLDAICGLGMTIKDMATAENVVCWNVWLCSTDRRRHLVMV